MSLLLLSLLACSGSKDSGSTATDDSTPTTDDSTPTGDDSGGGGNDEEKPVVSSIDYVDCTEQQSAGEVWTIMATVDDPQGEETVRAGSMDVLSNDRILATYDAACNSGQCIISFRSSYDGIGCDKMGSVVLRLTVSDTDGNSSSPYDYQTE